MALFGKKKEEKKPDQKDAVKEEKEVKKTSAVKSEKKKEISALIKLSNKVLIEPWITEKSHDLMAVNKYIFKVNKNSNKRSVKKAVEDLYQVEVIAVHVVNVRPKSRTFGRVTGWKSGYKKAIVTLKEGNKIELFEGV